jgi:hypothetical protein
MNSHEMRVYPRLPPRPPPRGAPLWLPRLYIHLFAISNRNYLRDGDFEVDFGEGSSWLKISSLHELRTHAEKTRRFTRKTTGFISPGNCVESTGSEVLNWAGVALVSYPAATSFSYHEQPTPKTWCKKWIESMVHHAAIEINQTSSREIGQQPPGIGFAITSRNPQNVGRIPPPKLFPLILELYDRPRIHQSIEQGSPKFPGLVTVVLTNFPARVTQMDFSVRSHRR